MKSKSLLATCLVFFLGGWLYGLVVAWQVERAEFLREKVTLCAFISLFFFILGGLLGIASGGARTLFGVFSSRRGRDSVVNPSPTFAAICLSSWGDFLFLLSILFALVDLAIGLAFRQDIARTWLVSRVLLAVVVGAALAWLLKGFFLRLLAKRPAAGKRALVAGLAFVALATLIPQPGSGGSVARPHVPVLERVAPAHRVVLFGLDGGTWKVIDRLLAEGRLPFMQRLIANGVRARMYSPPPHVSPAVWTTIVTGQPAKVHGVEQYLLVRIAGVRPFAFEALARKYLLLPFFAVGLAGFLAGVADGVPPTSEMVRAAPAWMYLARVYRLRRQPRVEFA